MRKKSIAIYLLGLLLLLLAATSCGKKDKQKPKIATEAEAEDAADVTEDFFEALEDQDFERAEQLVTPETRPVLEIVMNDARQQESRQDGKPEIKVVIVEKNPLLGQVNLKVQITVGKKVRKETLKLVLIDDDWRIVLPRKQLAFVRLVVLHEPIRIVLVEEKSKKHKHHPRGHAYGHRKHEDDD
jgi:hypothetical protein